MYSLKHCIGDLSNFLSNFVFDVKDLRPIVEYHEIEVPTKRGTGGQIWRVCCPIIFVEVCYCGGVLLLFSSYTLYIWKRATCKWPQVCNIQCYMYNYINLLHDIHTNTCIFTINCRWRNFYRIKCTFIASVLYGLKLFKINGEQN